MYTAARFVLVF